MGQPTTVQFPAGGGLSQKLAKQYLDPNANLVAATNGNFTKQGVIDKRLGIQHLPNTLTPGSPLPALTSGVRAASWSRSNLSIASTQGLYAYSAAEAGTVGVGALPPVRPIRRPITTTPSASYPYLCDFPFGASLLRLVVYVGTNYNLYATVYDANTGDVILVPTLVLSAAGNVPPNAPNIIQAMYLPNAPAGAQLAIVAVFPQSGVINYVTYNPSTNAFAAPIALTSLNTSAPICPDAVPFLGDPNGGWILFGWGSSGGSPAADWVYYQGSTLITNGTIETTTGAAEYPMYCYANYGASEVVWFAYQIEPTPGSFLQRIAALKGDGTFSVVAAPFTAQAPTNGSVCGGITRLDATRATVLYWTAIAPGGANGLDAPQGSFYNVTTLGTVSGATTLPLGFLPAARMFLVGSTMYQPCILNLYLQASVSSAATRSLQGTVYLLQQQASTGKWYPVATVAPRQVDLSFSVSSLLFQQAHIGLMSTVSATGASTRLALAFKLLGEDIAATSGAQGATWANDFYFDTASQAQLYQCAELGAELHISGGTSMVADSSTTFEDNFVYYPEFSYVTTTSGVFSSVTKSYAIVYVYPDAAGLLHRSAPYFPVSPALTAGQSYVVQIPALSVTWRDVANPGQVFAEIYRTVGDGGSTFYLVDRIAVSNTTAAYIRWPAAGGDNTADTAVSVSTLVYTTGGVLDNVIPPSSLLQITHRSRVVMVDETLRQTWESRAFTPGEAPGFNEVLITPYSEGGDITALASMDDKLLVFKVSSIWVRYGDGPADTGQGSDWTIPQRIASDVGCVAWQSCVLTPVGVMFQAQSGIYLINRGVSVSFIGAPVVDLLATYPTIVSAVLVPEANHARFFCTNGTTSAILVYDYLLQQWTSHVLAQLSAPVASTVLQPDGQLALVTTDGQLWQEHLTTDANAYLDDDSSGNTHFVPTTVTWPFVKIQGVQGYQRARKVMFLGESQDSCGLTMTVATDYNPTVLETATTTSANQLQVAPRLQFEHHVSGANNKAMAIQVSVTDSAGAAVTNGHGARFVALSVELDAIGQRYRRLPANLRS